VELYLHSPNTYSWRSAQLSTGTNLYLPPSLVVVEDEEEMDGICNTHGGDEKYLQKGRDHLEYEVVDWRVILKWILKE
jgi:hypothetical protein